MAHDFCTKNQNYCSSDTNDTPSQLNTDWTSAHATCDFTRLLFNTTAVDNIFGIGQVLGEYLKQKIYVYLASCTFRSHNRRNINVTDAW